MQKGSRIDQGQVIVQDHIPKVKVGLSPTLHSSKKCG